MNIEDIKVGSDMTTKERLEELVREWEKNKRACAKSNRRMIDQCRNDDAAYWYACSDVYRTCSNELKEILKDLQ